jgi:hypothetical protein
MKTKNKLAALLLAVASTAFGQVNAVIHINQIFYSQPGDTVASIEAECSAACVYVVNTHQTITLSANHTLSSTVGLEFVHGGSWTVNGAFTLTIGSGIVSGPIATQIFAGTSTITGLLTVRPEWFGGTNPLISTAINALASTGGLVSLAPQSQVIYRSGYDALSGLAMTKNNVEIAGSGICTPLDDLSTCTGGSRIIGEFDNSASYLNYHDFGVDDGCTATAVLYGGSPNNGLVFANPGQLLTFREKTVNLERVSGLVCGSTAAFHAALLENIDGLHADTIWAYGGTHGVVIKTLNSEVVGVVSKHHASECFYIKSDFYAPAGASSLHGLVASDCIDGLLVQGFDADLKGFTANGINCDSLVRTCIYVTGAVGGGGFVTSGIVLSDISSYAQQPLFSDPTVSDLQISNLTANSQQQNISINSTNTTLHGFQLLSVPVSISAVVVAGAATNTVIADGIISGTGSSGSPVSSVSSSSPSLTVSNIQFQGAWTGFCLVNTGSGYINASNNFMAGSCALGQYSGANFIVNGLFGTIVTTSGTTSNVITVPGTAPPLGCRFDPANSPAASDAANDYIDTIVLHSITFHHSSTNLMAFRISCNY